MTWILARKLLRDVRLAWCVTALLLFLFQILWSRITQRVSELLGQFNIMGISPDQLTKMVLKDNDLPGKMVQSIIGGENIDMDRAADMMSISYVHPLVITILCVWAIGRAANAIAGEIDRGTMELLLAQPIRRTQIVLAHLLVDAIVFPGLCLVLWMGTFTGTWLMGLQAAPGRGHVEPVHYLPGLLCMLGLLWSVSGLTLWISALGRSQARVWGWGISIVLAMFLLNVLGQIWSDALEWLRPLTIFYHYQPQPMILQAGWYKDPTVWLHLLTLGSIGLGGYFLAWTAFIRRDLPAPL